VISLKVLKIPLMSKKEYDKFISDGYVSRIAFKGDYPYIAPFIYVFDGSFIYFLSTKYGKKMKLFLEDPQVAVEIEDYPADLSQYRFVTLQGRIQEVTDEEEKNKVRKMFVNMINEKGLSPKIMAALGHSPKDSPEALAQEERSFVWKLVDVQEIVALKNG
jgi:nitroimidazol reductase NimA-like FMN-containing flavoprotein (pyridoxamine 5'-phosphate oxidase superfamily)